MVVFTAIGGFEQMSDLICHVLKFQCGCYGLDVDGIGGKRNKETTYWTIALIF